MHASPSATAIDPRLARTLWQWLALGVLALLAWPAARGHTAWLGWGPYWAVVAPAIALLVAYRHRWFDDRRPVAPTATAHRRRVRAASGQAQRLAAPQRGRQLHGGAAMAAMLLPGKASPQ